jgi:hypothetical protein
MWVWRGSEGWLRRVVQKGGSRRRFRRWFRRRPRKRLSRNQGTRRARKSSPPPSFYGSLPELNTLVTSLKITTDANSTRKTNAVW